MPGDERRVVRVRLGFQLLGLAVAMKAAPGQGDVSGRADRGVRVV